MGRSGPVVVLGKDENLNKGEERGLGLPAAWAMQHGPSEEFIESGPIIQAEPSKKIGANLFVNGQAALVQPGSVTL